MAYVAAFFFLISGLANFIWFAVGVACGLGFLLADEQYFVKYYQESEKSGRQFLVTRSPLFLLALPPLAVMVLTSFGSFWASGVMGGMILWLLLEMLVYRAHPEAFAQRFLQGMKVESPAQTIQVALTSGWVFFVVVHIFAIL